MSDWLFDNVIPPLIVIIAVLVILMMIRIILAMYGVW